MRAPSLRTASKAGAFPARRPNALGVLAVLSCVALLLISSGTALSRSPGRTGSDLGASVNGSAQITLEAFNSQQVSQVLALAPLLHAGDTVDLGKSLSNHTPDIATLNSWAQRLSPSLPSGVLITARVESLPNVLIAARSLAPLFGGITIDYEPSTAFFPLWTWDFSAALAYFAAATAICHLHHRIAVAYPTGRPLLENDLQKYHWDYGRIAGAVDRVDVETQRYGNTSVWAVAIPLLASQFTSASVPLSELSVQLSLGGGGNGVGESVAISDVKFALAHSIEAIYLWWDSASASWVGPIVKVIEQQAPAVSAVTFAESGLPSGARWWVNVTGDPPRSSSGTNVSFTEPNGTYAFSIGAANSTYAPTPSSGTFSVAGSNVTARVVFSTISYAVTFVETGLPNGTAWWLNVTPGESRSVSGASVSFATPNGSYRFVIGSGDPNWVPVPRGGTFQVQGAPETVAVGFTLALYPVSFVEQGLPVGTPWTVRLDGGQLTSSGSAIVEAEPNGSYRYAVEPVTGFTLAGSANGTIVVAGQPVRLGLSFAPVAGGPQPSPSGRSAGPAAPWSGALVLVGASAVGGLVAAAVWRRRRGGPSGELSPQSDPRDPLPPRRR